MAVINCANNVDPVEQQRPIRTLPAVCDQWSLDLPHSLFSRFWHWVQLPRRLGVHSNVAAHPPRSEEHTSELQSLMRISYAVFCLKKKNNTQIQQHDKT